MKTRKEWLCHYDAGAVSMETWVSRFHADFSALCSEASINYYYLMNYSTAEGLEPSEGRVWLWSWPEVTVTASAMSEVEMTLGLTPILLSLALCPQSLIGLAS